MSNKHITLAFKSDLSPTVKLTLIAVCDSVDEDGSWKLRYETIAEKTSQSRRAVMGHVKTLSEMGVISVQKTRREDGRQGANIFTINLDALSGIQSADSDKSQSADDVISETQSADGDISRVQMASFQSAANDTPSTPCYPQDLPTSTPHTPQFADFWFIWRPFDMLPGNKGKADESWRKNVIEPGLDPAMVIEQARAYCEACHRTCARTQHAVTWLNQSGWEQDYGPPMSFEDMARRTRMEKYRRDEDEGEQDRNRELGYSDAGKRPMDSLAET